ncbi:MAG: molecular chaperone HtpG [Nitrospira sp.]|nr:molecular chaperone HtpG [Candidatus Manganitrophaceae bacterium]HIL35212.1 molecular chaperone HtpG [Candidatus Manganitrophaceae bacterium]
MSAVSGKKETFEYKAEMNQLLNLIVHSLYTHPEIFLRELISNASDASNKVRYLQMTDDTILDRNKELTIKIEVDEKAQRFSIEDAGVGMSRKDLINNIGKIASSGTLKFLEQAKGEKDDFGDLIGQFGVGFYSAFMVTDQIVIETRYADKEGVGLRWTSSLGGNYTIEEIERKERGTKISFQLKDEFKELSTEVRIKNTIKKYSNFADFPIYVGKEQVNTIAPLWTRKAKDLKEEELNEFYKFIANDWEDPLDYLSLSLEGVGATFKALLFIPKNAPFELMRMQEHKTLQLYSNRVMIMEDCKDLLPEYLQFVRGVVDTEDLPLNVSRETVQSSPVMQKIKTTLTQKILAWLDKMATKESKKYAEFYSTFGKLFKYGVNSDFSNKEKIVDLLRFESSGKNEGVLSSFKEYVTRMKDDQKEIYYLSGESRDQVETNPNMEYFKKHETEVLYLIDPVDAFIIPSIPEYDKKPVKAIDKGDLDLQGDEKEGEKEKNQLSNALIDLFKETLKDRAKEVRVSKRLVDSAVTLVASADGADKHTEQLMKMMGQEVPLSKRILEVNADHPVIRNLSKRYIANDKDPLISKCILGLFESAQLIDDELVSKNTYVKRMMEIMEEATQ